MDQAASAMAAAAGSRAAVGAYFIEFLPSARFGAYRPSVAGAASKVNPDRLPRTLIFPYLRTAPAPSRSVRDGDGQPPKATARAKALAKPASGTVITVGSFASGFVPETVRFCAVRIASVASVGRLIGTRQPSETQ